MANITGYPNIAVSNLSVPTFSDGSLVLTSTWSVPSAMTDDNSSRRATSLRVSWNVSWGGYAEDGVYYLPSITTNCGVDVTTSSIDLNGYMAEKWYTRESFYPYTGKYLRWVGVQVNGVNAKGVGVDAYESRYFSPPEAPSISDIEFDTSNGHCNTTIKAVENDIHRELHDIYYKMSVKGLDGIWTVVSEDASTSTEFTLTYDVSGYQSFEYDEYVCVEVQAYARGIAGKSDTVSRRIYISYPAKAIITKTSVSAKDSTGKLTVGINTNKSTEHPVDKVTLEYMANTTFENASDITGSWTDAGIEDNGDCTALAMPVENLIPDRGKFTWIRVKTVHLHERVLYRYSDYVRLTDLETPPADLSEDGAVILSAVSGEEGTSAVVLIGWNRSGEDDSIGTELTWSDEEDTWKSTKDPDLHDFEWSDGSITYEGVTYHGSAEITIKGLNEGEKYYIRARRYYEGDTRSYGRYSNTATVVTSEKPAGVVARCSRYVSDGQPLSVYWTFSGNGIQKEWQIVKSNGTVIASGEGSTGSTQISASRLKALAENNTLSFTVQVSTGSGYVSSDQNTVTILHKPTLAIDVPTTITAQPLSFTATASSLCDLILTITSQGASGQFPIGLKMQPSGDTIYSDVLSPRWTNGSATITTPNNLELWNGGQYTLSVVAVDRDTGLKSREIKKRFKASWAHTAVSPDGFVVLTPKDIIVGGAEHLQGVEIALTPPTGSRSSDVYDIYRMGGDVATLIGESFPLTCTVTDKYAPFSSDEDMHYRIALRTSDGDTDFVDVAYTLSCSDEYLRLDWQGGSLELPYGTAIGENYSKSVEFRQHMDGSVDGYWNSNIEHGASYSSSVIKLIQPREIALAKQLARYAGAVFVRTSNGSAFAADVQVTDLSVKNKAVTAIAIDATEVGITEEFMLPKPR